MTRELDAIKFESKQELHDTYKALETYLDEHPEAENKANVERLLDLIDITIMEW